MSFYVCYNKVRLMKGDYTMKKLDAYVIAHISCTDKIPDYLVSEDSTVIQFKTKAAAERFVCDLAPDSFILDESSIQIFRIH